MSSGQNAIGSFILFQAVCIDFLLIATLIVRLTGVNFANVQKTLATSDTSDGRTVKKGIHKEYRDHTCFFMH